MASFAALGDVIIAEPGALMSFAGPRVVQQTTREKLPDDFGLAESNFRFGHIDMIVPAARAARHARPAAAPVRGRRVRLRRREHPPVRSPPACSAACSTACGAVRTGRPRRTEARHRTRSAIRAPRAAPAHRRARGRVGHLGCGRARAPRRASVHARLRRAPARRLHRAPRRPCRRRRSGDRRRARPLPRPHDRARRAPEGARPQAARLPQLRQRPARGLRQGDPRVRAREPPRLPGADVRRHAGRASRASRRRSAGRRARSRARCSRWRASRCRRSPS